jgi:hypothetical protein
MALAGVLQRRHAALARSRPCPADRAPGGKGAPGRIALSRNAFGASWLAGSRASEAKPAGTRKTASRAALLKEGPAVNSDLSLAYGRDAATPPPLPASPPSACAPGASLAWSSGKHGVQALPDAHSARPPAGGGGEKRPPGPLRRRQRGGGTLICRGGGNPCRGGGLAACSEAPPASAGAAGYSPPCEVSALSGNACSGASGAGVALPARIHGTVAASPLRSCRVSYAPGPSVLRRGRVGARSFDRCATMVQWRMRATCEARGSFQADAARSGRFRGFSRPERSARAGSTVREGSLMLFLVCAGDCRRSGGLSPRGSSPARKARRTRLRRLFGGPGRGGSAGLRSR